MDGLMCEDIRIGIQVRTELQKGMWRRIRFQDGAVMPMPGTWVSFSSMVLAEAGGIRRLFAEWEQEA